MWRSCVVNVAVYGNHQNQRGVDLLHTNPLTSLEKKKVSEEEWKSNKSEQSCTKKLHLKSTFVEVLDARVVK